MAEWLYESGIGEARAALIAGGRIVEARIERPGTLRVGTVLPAKLVERLSPVLTRAETPRGEVVMQRMPAGTTLGQTVLVEILREAIPEPGKLKLPRALLAGDGAVERDGPDLLLRCAAQAPVRALAAHEPDLFEAAGWSETLDEAITGEIAFSGGSLRMSPTPAMVLFDVDGPTPPAQLAPAAATAVGLAIRRLDIGGSIGVDFPTLGNKAERQAAADAIDRVLPQPFERTAINGFGFMQIVRPRPRASLAELLRSDPGAAEALALVRSVERTPPPVPADQPAGPRALAWLAGNPHIVAELSRRTGAAITFRGS